MGNAASDEGSLIDPQCCSTRATRDRMVPTFAENAPLHKNAERDHHMTSDDQDEDTNELYGVGLVFRTTRDGKLVVSSFIRDSSAFECGLVRDGDVLCAVDQMPMEGVPLDTVHHLLLGEKESWVQMRFLRQTDAKASSRLRPGPGGGAAFAALGGDARDHALGSSVEDTRWASSKMRSFAPTYDTVVVDLCRKTPSTILNEAALQAREEAHIQRQKRR